MNESGTTPTRDIHMTHPQRHSQEQSRWPSLAAAGFVAMAVGLTVAPWLAVLGALAIMASIVGVAREVNPPRAQNAARPPPHQPTKSAPEHPPVDFWMRFPKHAWLGAGLSIAAGMLYVTVLRTFVTHALFLPENWPPPARDLATLASFAATGAILGSAVAANLGGAALRRGSRGAGLAGLGAALLLGAAFLAALALQWTELAGAGFVPWQGPAASGYYALTSYHALSVIGGLTMLSILAWHTLDRRLGDKQDAAMTGTLVFWTFTAAAWLTTFLIVYLRLIVWEGRALLH